MKSPFPGMDPYLEDPAFWPDFHATFIVCWRERIADALPDNYEVRIFEHVFVVEEAPDVSRLMEPDGAIIRTKRRATRKILEPSATTTLAPVTIPVIVLD